MKVLVLSHMYPYASEPTFGLFVSDQVRELARRCEVVVVSPSPLSPPIMRQLKVRWARYASKPSETTWEGTKVYYPRYICMPGVHGFPLSALFYRWAIKRLLVRLKKTFDFDLMHAHAICPDGFAAASLGQRVGVPTICTIHGADVNIYPHRTRLTHLITRQAIRSVDFIITVSAALREKTLVLETPKQAIRVIPNGFDHHKFALIDRYSARERLGLPQDKKILVFTSRLDHAKGLSYLLSAFRTVLEHRSDCLLVLVGDGPYRNHLEQEVRELGLQKDVLLMGLRPHAEIAEWMSAADLVVQPSLNEGSPLPVYEALACGKPMIASRVGGIPELIISDDYGLLVPPANSEALSEALLYGLQKEWDTERIKRHSEQYTWTHVADQLLGLYEQILASQAESRVGYPGLYERV
jgi:teichuronic acid biosynthesis glycosyltransferase TuaC